MDSVVSVTPLLTNDAVVFGCLMVLLALVFQTTAMPSWRRFYKVVPALLLCYFLPSVLNTVGLISLGWIDLPAALEFLQGKGHDVAGITRVAQLKDLVADQGIDARELAPFIGKSQLYFVASRYLLPASLVLSR